MIKLVLCGFGITLLWACAIIAAPGAEDRPDVPRIAKEKVAAMLKEKAVTLIDVRTGASWTQSDKKITGARREDPTNPGGWADKYAKDTTLVLYCS